MYQIIFSEGGDSGVFSSSFYSDQDQTESLFRLSMSQSFGKSFPDITEDESEVTDAVQETVVHQLNSAKLSSSFPVSSAAPTAPAKPKRSMITSYSNNSLHSSSSSVRARVQQFESMSGNTISSRRSITYQKTNMVTENRKCESQYKRKVVNNEKKDSTPTSSTPNHCIPTPPPAMSSSISTPAPIMSISSSSSATSCGYKDFLIDDDYIDQQQLTLTLK